ncbi:MAG: hypothetical protein IJD81_05445 [Oscillospiraceae bacterium]|nr:hypothetical protein [Oscillospiraceae bacterium]
MGMTQFMEFMKEAVKRVIVIMLALILVMIVASRNVEYDLEQEALSEQVQMETEGQNP